MSAPFWIFVRSPISTPTSMNTSRPTTHSAPIRAPDRIWARCQTALPVPITTSSSMSAESWTRAPGIDHRRTDRRIRPTIRPRDGSGHERATPVEQRADRAIDLAGDEQEHGAGLAHRDPVGDERADKALVDGDVLADREPDGTLDEPRFAVGVHHADRAHLDRHALARRVPDGPGADGDVLGGRPADAALLHVDRVRVDRADAALHDRHGRGLDDVGATLADLDAVGAHGEGFGRVGGSARPGHRPEPAVGGRGLPARASFAASTSSWAWPLGSAAAGARSPHLVRRACRTA